MNLDQFCPSLGYTTMVVELDVAEARIVFRMLVRVKIQFVSLSRIQLPSLVSQEGQQAFFNM